MKIYISHASSSDYENELYAPLRKILKDHDVFYPHDPNNSNVEANDIMKNIDLLIAEVSYPSTGQGIELGYAYTNGVPIICFHKTNTTPSTSLKFVTDKIVEYRSTNQLVEKISDLVKE